MHHTCAVSLHLHLCVRVSVCVRVCVSSQWLDRGSDWSEHQCHSGHHHAAHRRSVHRPVGGLPHHVQEGNTHSLVHPRQKPCSVSGSASYWVGMGRGGNGVAKESHFSCLQILNRFWLLKIVFLSFIALGLPFVCVLCCNPLQNLKNKKNYIILDTLLHDSPQESKVFYRIVPHRIKIKILISHKILTPTTVLSSIL